MKSKILFVSFFFILVTAVLHIIASINHFYWNSFYFDALMHFLGAVSVGTLSVWFWFQSGIFEVEMPKRREIFFYVLVCTVFIGIGWEVFEWAYGVANPIGGNYPLDTYHDLMFDFIGAIVAGAICLNKKLYV